MQLRLSACRGAAAVLLLGAYGLSACSDDDTERRDGQDVGVADTDDASVDDTTPNDADPTTDAVDPTDTTPSDDVADTDGGPQEVGPDADTSTDTLEDTTVEPPAELVADCDPLDPSFCALPWPSNLYLVEDPARVTGYTLTFGATTLPASRTGRAIDPAPYRRLDGYGFGVPVMTIIPDVDLTDFPGEESLERSVEADSPSLLFERTTSGLVRVPHWVELDENGDDEADRLLYLRPAVILAADTEYVVAFRDVPLLSGATATASDAFRALRDNEATDDPAIESRRDAMDEMFAALETAGVDRASLYLAWPFHTASEEALHRTIDRGTELALAAIGEEGAPLHFDDVRRSIPEADDTDTHVDPWVAIRVNGRMTSPHIVRRRTGSSFELSFDETGAVTLADPADVAVRIQVPHRALSGEPVGVIVYGHGLFGNQDEIAAWHLRRIGEELGYVLVSTPFRGMSADDGAAVLATTTNMSNAVFFGDSIHQGVIQTHVLARTAITRLPGMLQELDANINVDTSRLYWFGGSQGGIFGTTIIATSPDIERGVLAVGGNNYSTMLQRSTNFTVYFDSLANSYPSKAEVGILIAMVQLMWDFTDPVSYWRRMLRDDSPAGNPRDALLLLSKSDKQVPVVTNEIAARTFPEIQVMGPYDDERTPWDVPLVDYPTTGTAMVLFDFGNPWPIGRGNRPPNDPARDPHPRIAEVDETAELIEGFLDERRIVDVCGGTTCYFGD